MKKNGFAAMLAGIFLFAALFVFSEEFIKGINTGLINCVRIIIPSLFPFLIASSLTGSGDMPERIKRLFDPLSRFLFRLPAECLPAIIIAQTGGYLAGAKAVQTLYSNGTLTQSSAERMMYFCVNAGLGFSVNAVGNAMLCSREAGRVIFASLCISSLITGIFFRFTPDNNSAAVNKGRLFPDFSAAVVGSVTSASQAMLTVCAFTALFSGICAVADSRIKNETARLILFCLLEVTNGCAAAVGKASLPVIAAVCAFGGVCVHLQIFSLLREFGLKKLPFCTFRLIHAASAYAVCRLIIYFHPVEQPVFLSFSQNAAAFSFSAPAAISLLLLCFLLILDLDNSRKIC